MGIDTHNQKLFKGRYFIISMVRIHIVLDSKLEKKFRLALVKEGRHKKGEISKKISELIEADLKKEKK